MRDYLFVICRVQRNCGSSRHFAMCCTLQKFTRFRSSVFIFKFHMTLETFDNYPFNKNVSLRNTHIYLTSQTHSILIN